MRFAALSDIGLASSGEYDASDYEDGQSDSGVGQRLLIEVHFNPPFWFTVFRCSETGIALVREGVDVPTPRD